MHYTNIPSNSRGYCRHHLKFMNQTMKTPVRMCYGKNIS